jgi:small subunit ribosomal protein S17
MPQARGHKKVREGVVVSDHMDKTVVVAVQRLISHPVYKKVVRRTSKFAAHDPENRCQVGDRVRIMETRPLSRRKRFRVVSVLGKAE